MLHHLINARHLWGAVSRLCDDVQSLRKRSWDLKVWGSWSYLNRNFINLPELHWTYWLVHLKLAVLFIMYLVFQKVKIKKTLCKFKQHSVSELLTVKFAPCPINFPAQWCHENGHTERGVITHLKISSESWFVIKKVVLEEGEGRRNTKCCQLVVNRRLYLL